MGKKRIGELLTALACFDAGVKVEFLTTYDLLCKFKGTEVFPRFLNGRFGSYRGYYDEMHIGYVMTDTGKNTVGNLVEVLCGSVKHGVMHGYKGGEYRITEDTPVWIALDSGDCSGLFVADVQELNGTVIIMLGEDTY